MLTKCIINVCVHTCSTTRRLHTVCLYDRQIRDHIIYIYMYIYMYVCMYIYICIYSMTGRSAIR